MLKQIKLISKTYTVDAIGNRQATTTYKEVFCDVKSVTSQEFANAGQIGIKPSDVFIIWAHEYEGNEEVLADGEIYSIYRTYKREDGRIELYTEKRIGER